MGTFVTGNTALPALKTDANPPTGASTELDAADINNLWSAAGDLRTAMLATPQTNFLPNTQWKIATAIPSSTKMNPQGTGTEPAITVTSYTTGANTVTFQTGGASTYDLKVGDLVALQAPADANTRISTLRVTSMVTNTSFTASLPMGLTASVSSACTAVITMAGGSASAGSGDAFDGWSKSTTAQVWREDNAVNTKAGSLYSAGIKKGAVSSETMSFTPPATDMASFIGRQVVFGAWVMQKVKGGLGTWRAFISSDGTGGTTAYSSSAAATAYSWLEVSYTIPTDATTVSMGISFDGANGDVYYVSQPMGGFGNVIGTGNYRPRPDEILIPKVKFTPLTYNGASLTFPASANAAGDWSVSVDIYAETNGAIAPTTKRIMMQLEGKNATVGHVIAARDVVSAPIRYAIVNYAQAANTTISQAGVVTLDGTGRFVLYSNTSADAWSLVSIDVNGYNP